MEGHRAGMSPLPVKQGSDAITSAAVVKVKANAKM